MLSGKVEGCPELVIVGEACPQVVGAWFRGRGRPRGHSQRPHPEKVRLTERWSWSGKRRLTKRRTDGGFGLLDIGSALLVNRRPILRPRGPPSPRKTVRGSSPAIFAALLNLDPLQDAAVRSGQVKVSARSAIGWGGRKQTLYLSAGAQKFGDEGHDLVGMRGGQADAD